MTRIAPGGEHGVHVDEYSQVFCVMHGAGEGEVNAERITLEPGVIMRTQTASRTPSAPLRTNGWSF